VSPKTLALIAAAVAVAGMGVYLFVQVQATPAQAHVSPQATARQSHVPERSPDPEPTPPSAPSPAPTRSPAVSAPAPSPRVFTPAPTPEPATPTDDQRANPRMDAMMDLANKAYDGQDFDQAIAIATKVLSKDPTNVRMLRIIVSANCIGGDTGVAQQYYEKLPAFDQGQMKTRCERYGVFFNESQ